jgi:signal transduction histidine kinase
VKLSYRFFSLPPPLLFATQPDLLLLARTDKVSSFEFERINLTTLLTDLVNLYKPQAQTKQIELKAEIESDLWLNGDKAKLARAFTNLIQNAIQYTPAGGEVQVTGNRIGKELNLIRHRNQVSREN